MIALPANAHAEISASEIIRETNEYRAARGLPQLATSTQLAAAAAAKANDLIEKQYWAHNSPTGTTPWYWIKEAGYSFQYAGENLAVAYDTDQQVLGAWEASPAHNENLINEHYSEIGVAVAVGTFRGATKTYVVQMFGSPKIIHTEPIVEKRQLAIIKTEGDAPSAAEVAGVAPRLKVQTYAGGGDQCRVEAQAKTELSEPHDRPDPRRDPIEPNPADLCGTRRDTSQTHHDKQKKQPKTD